LSAMSHADPIAFEAGKRARQFLAAQSTTAAECLGQAEQLWGERGSAALAASLQGLGAGDLQGFEKYRACREFLANEVAGVRPVLDKAVSGWAERSARAAVATLRKVQAGDTDSYIRSKEHRAALVKLFPDLKARFIAAEQAWAEEGARWLVAELDKIPAGQ